MAGIWQLFVDRVAATPEADAVCDEHASPRSWAHVAAAVDEVAAGLAALGIGPGSVVSWQLPTRTTSLEVALALCRLGAVQNPMLPAYRERELSHIIDECGTEFLLVPGVIKGHDHAATARAVLDESPSRANVRLIVCEPDVPRGDVATLGDPTPADPEKASWVFYTSGTTSKPKGARHSDAGLMASGRSMVEGLSLGPDDGTAIVFPFAHVGGMGNVCASLPSGMRLLFIEQWSGEASMEICREFGITVAGAGPPFFRMYLEAQRRLPAGVPLFPKLKTYCGGGAPVPPQLHYALRAQAGGSGISGSYGLTECPMITFASPSDSDEVRANTAGKARQGGEIKIVDADGNRVPTGTPGEILVRGPMLTMGYADESLNAAAFDAEGWFRTGDLGSLDAMGNVNISGRVKDVIIRNMENVSPAEVEQLLTDHPAISDLAVIGLPDERTGERVVAVVILVRGATLTLPDLAKWCREQGIMPQKIPEQLEIVEALPRIGYGKTDKIKLRQRFVG